MSDRDQFIQAVQNAQPALMPLPSLIKPTVSAAVLESYKTVLQKIGGKIVEVKDQAALLVALRNHALQHKRVITHLPYWQEVEIFQETDGHRFEDTDLLVLESPIAVAENGAVWVDDLLMPQRVLPFITQHLAVVVNVANVIPTMHEAYEFISERSYGFGVFIAGPSKTADIEQSLVLGAHGPKTMTVFLLHG